MRTLSTLLHATSDTATAALYVASIAVGVGGVAAAYTHQLRYGLIVGAGTFICAGAGFGFGLWRTYGPHIKHHRLLHRRR